MMAARAAAASRRERSGRPRDSRVTIRLSEDEKAELVTAAERTGMALAAYLGQVCMDVVKYRSAPRRQVQRDMLAELIRTGAQIRRASTDFHRAVDRLNETGAAGPDLGPAAQYLARVARDVDEAVLRVSQRLL
jgi:hypothetical protein